MVSYCMNWKRIILCPEVLINFISLQPIANVAFMKYFFFILLTVFILPHFSFGQDYSSWNCPDSITLSLKKDSLEIIYGKNKIIPRNIEVAAFYALSFYPELKNTKIVFKRKKIKTTLNVRPTFFSLIFRKRENRKYIVRVNNSSDESKVTIDDVPFNASIGLLGHEFGHIADYTSKGFFGVLGRGFAYMSKKKRKEYENEIDEITIDRGLGKALYRWSYFVLNKSNASREYKEFKRETYMRPEDILHAVKD